MLLLIVSSCVLAAAARPTGARTPAETKTVAFSILEDYDKGEPLADVARDFALFHELGITTWRGSIPWDHYEPSRGRFDFGWLERFAALAARDGITLRPYLAYTPQWAAGGDPHEAWHEPPRRLADWTAFVTAVARALRRYPNVVSFEIYNEENVPQWWSGTAAGYNRVLRAAADAIHAANPHLQVIFGGMVFPDARWIGAACTAAHNGPKFDVIPFHAYPETWTPPGVDVEHYLGDGFGRDFVRPADRACGPKPIWINETGFATTPGRSELDQAEWWARAIATFVAAPRIQEIGVYEIKDLRQDREAIGGAANYHLGITNADRKKKLAFSTIRRLVALLGGTPVTVDDAALKVGVAQGDPAHVYHHMFTRRDGRRVVLVWDKIEAARLELGLPGTATRAVEYAIDGTASPYGRLDGTTLADVALEPGRVRIFEVTP